LLFFKGELSCPYIKGHELQARASMGTIIRRHKLQARASVGQHFCPLSLKI
jgi:hypothetical protein